ncbi:BON domain-containing protein [Anaeromyxobacter oryzae]|uniref:BON domain-containing protein n=1 Tax=Anaeromyxobacter oryzae TaxID=2918170 RepID=A0ABM7X4C3_9BACT|nr:BON domain-containing protein [Anaeromyxobacter oryzae]BDG06654.1 hypothetical protein AMOR_56500 [Anaeromyxobacter oryzae]
MARWDEERRWEGRDPWSEGDGGSGSARRGERSEGRGEGWSSGGRWRGEEGGWRGREERDERGGWGEPIRRGESRTYAPRGGREGGDWRREREWRGQGDWRGQGSEDWRREARDWRDREYGQRHGQDYEHREAEGHQRSPSWLGEREGEREGGREERGRDWRGGGTYAGPYGGMFGYGGYGGEYEGRGDWDRRGMWGEPSYGSGRERWGREPGREYGTYGRHEGEHEDRGPMERLGDRMKEGWRKMTGRGPKGYRRSDERIREDVCERIARAGVDADEVEVKVLNAEVILTGEVQRREDKRMLEDLAEDVFGVDEVQNQLRVRREGARTFEQGQAAQSATTTPGLPGTQAGGQQRPATQQQPPQRH